MASVQKTIGFEQWVRYLFEHPVSDPAWHWDDDSEEVKLASERLIAYTTRLFIESEECLAPFSDEQVDQGLWFLAGEATTDLYALGEEEVPLAARLDCIRAISVLYEKCFVRRCSEHLSHTDRAGVCPLNTICYMWWDVFPLRGAPDEPLRREVDEACLSAMERALSLRSIACQESALHGLGHWVSEYKERCEEIIGAFINSNQEHRPELRNYAMKAIEGNIQ